MPKTLVLLLITLMVCVLGIGVAFLVGQQTAEQRLRSEIDHSREEQRALLEEFKRDLAPQVQATAPIVTPPAPAEIPHTEPVSTPAEQEPITVARAEPQPEPVAPAPVVTEAATEPLPAAPTSETPAPETEPVAPPVSVSATETLPTSPPAIAKTSFDAMALGTPYTDVAAAFGRDGLAALTMQDATGTETKHYFWDWIGPEGRACRVSMRFVDGRLTDKIYRD